MLLEYVTTEEEIESVVFDDDPRFVEPALDQGAVDKSVWAGWPLLLGGKLICNIDTLPTDPNPTASPRLVTSAIALGSRGLPFSLSKSCSRILTTRNENLLEFMPAGHHHSIGTVKVSDTTLIS